MEEGKRNKESGGNFKLELILLMLIGLVLAPKFVGGRPEDSIYAIAQGEKVREDEDTEPKGERKWQTGESDKEIVTEKQSSGLVINYVSGSVKILNQETEEKRTEDVAVSENVTENLIHDQVPIELSQSGTEAENPEPEKRPVGQTESNSGQELPVSGGVYTSFTPVYYPKLSDIIGSKYVLDDLKNLNFLKSFYIVNNTTKMTEEEFDAEYFLKADLSIVQSEEPQILIYHTHGTEGFIDSREGESEDTILGMGERLAEFLRKKYGYSVIHDTTLFDWSDGRSTRNSAYNRSLPYVEELLKKYPTIEVIIDLHRDAGEKRVETIDGKQVAKVMLFNGLCRNTQGKLTYLPNEHLADNLAFSFQMKLIGDEMYPGLMHKIFLKDYRYNMHLAERYLLVELGTNENTVEEAKNAMEPLADVLAQVLGGGENME